jgi:predicted SnoaL-like aldol condensation-catalyzing enzyme
MHTYSPQLQAACDFLRRAAAGDVDEAFRRHVHEHFVHHHCSARGDREGLRQAMSASARAMPGKAIDTRIVLEDGDRVCTASLVTAPGMHVAVMHIFRFEDGMIRELWDVGQPVPADSPNENGPF